ncbi:hypothetical protein DFJ73DRAFT_812537 [Zopfochytrium polystomum]|nr:hypothetical protein DFJ73DRAFT_812537 [Zopfochytrium polystomum]
MIGGGVAAVLSTRPRDAGVAWVFHRCSLTGPSTWEMLKLPDALSRQSVEDFIRLWGGQYTSGREDSACHVVIDDHIVTGQNRHSTLIAIQNFILTLKR